MCISTSIRVYSHSHQRESRNRQCCRKLDGSVKGWNFLRNCSAGAFGVTGLSEPERMLPLLFAPVGAIYFRIRKYTSGRRPQFALILPDIDDLPSYARVRWSIQRARLPELLVSGTAEAGWRVLALIEADGLLTRLRSPACRIVSFGTVPWASQQKTRVEIFSVRMGSPSIFENVRACRQYLPIDWSRRLPALLLGVPVTPNWWRQSCPRATGTTVLPNDERPRDTGQNQI